MKAPAFQFYVRDWILSRSISKMTGDEVKAYVYLLCESWLEEPRATLPNDDEELARMSQTSTEKWLKVKGRVMANFSLSDGRWVNLKLHGVSENQSQFQKWGKMGGNPKLVKKHKFEPKEVNPIVNPTVNGSHNPIVNLATATATSTSSLTSNKEEEEAIKISINHLINEWNGSMEIQCLKVTDKRKAALRQRYYDPFFVDNWRLALEKVKASPFCGGQNDRGWKADIDWFLKPDSVPRIMEGKYDQKSTALASKPSYSFDFLDKKKTI